MFKQLSSSSILITITIISVYSSLSSAAIDDQAERELRASMYSNRLDVKAFLKVLRTYIPDSRTFRTFNLLVNQHCSCGGGDKKESKKGKKTKLSVGNEDPKRFYKSPYIESKSDTPDLFRGHILIKQQR